MNEKGKHWVTLDKIDRNCMRVDNNITWFSKALPTILQTNVGILSVSVISVILSLDPLIIEEDEDEDIEYNKEEVEHPFEFPYEEVLSDVKLGIVVWLTLN